MTFATVQAKEQIRQQIAEDRQRKAEKSQQSKVKSVPAPTQPSVGGGTTSTATPTQCRVQVNWKMLPLGVSVGGEIGTVLILSV